MKYSEILHNVFLQSEGPEGLSDHAMQAAILESQGSLAGLKKVLIIPPIQPGCMPMPAPW